MSEPVSYRTIAEYYEACLDRHGDSHLGVDWPNSEDARTRYRVMLDVVREPATGRPVRLLDVGCGASHLYEHVRANGIPDIDYAGLDISEKFVELSRSKYPEINYWCADLLANDVPSLPRFDYAVMNGIFTEKLELPFAEMLSFMKQLVLRVFGLVDHGLAFNVMSAQVDWEREDLFHLPFDLLADWLASEFGRNFVFRSDYGLYEYTAYVYR